MPAIGLDQLEESMGRAARAVDALDPERGLNDLRAWVEAQIDALREQFDSASTIDLSWHTGVHEGRFPFDEAMRERIEALYAAVAERGGRLLRHVEFLEGNGHEVNGSARLRDDVSECRGILTDDAEFFDDPRLAELQDQAIAEHRAGLSEPSPELDRELGSDRARAECRSR